MNELCIFDPIGVDPETGQGMTAKQFDASLKALGDPSAFLLRINSPGGDVFEAMAIYSMLKASRARITARIEGIAASAASLIAMAADTIEISPNAFMLIHQPWTQASGSADDLATAAGDLQRMSDSYAKIYAARSGQSAAAVKALMDEDRLMSADEAVKLGYADFLASGAGDAPNMSGLPRKHRAAIKAARRDRSHSWDLAVALATGKRTINLQRDRAVNASWEKAIDSIKAERGGAAGSGWDAAIAKMKR
ncbi:Clp protease ClpP [Labrys sp. LIt4]|uniref:head maturation protease, ClpP-related n=1 Tax=Labrys sp. LIt4 TaxID=2821355 RepID=UPI001ADF02DD|nr:head maturation protease, ClpP-related [Labrys sp. LIt4]MBP0578988.1 Clp protease ClpP [Labrys sp. LIt4]